VQAPLCCCCTARPRSPCAWRPSSTPTTSEWSWRSPAMSQAATACRWRWSTPPWYIRFHTWGSMLRVTLCAHVADESWQPGVAAGTAAATDHGAIIHRVGLAAAGAATPAWIAGGWQCCQHCMGGAAGTADPTGACWWGGSSVGRMH
jgi:hypothetical protein